MKSRGLLKSILINSDELLFDTLHSTTTSGIIRPYDINDITDEQRKNSYNYQPVAPIIFKEVISHIPESMRSATFIDYGCGMGRALLLAAEAGFTNIIGIDHSASLIEICKKNIFIYKTKHNNRSITVSVTDATVFEIPNDAQLFFFFNPFKEEVMSIVSKKIQSHLTHIRKKGYILYINPIYEHLFIKLNFTREVCIKSKSGYKEATILSVDHNSRI